MSEYVEYLKEVFELFGRVEARRMFGGYGLFHQGVMFALVSDDSLYLKADGEIVGLFEGEGLEPFRYSKQGKRIALSYYEAPEHILDDRDEAALWAHRSYQAALRSAASKTRPSR